MKNCVHIEQEFLINAQMMSGEAARAMQSGLPT